MTKAIELADKLDYLADNDAENWQTLGNAAAELRRLAAVEQELEDLKASMGEPVAQIIRANDDCGTVEWLVHSGRPISVGQKLYAIKAAK